MRMGRHDREDRDGRDGHYGRSSRHFEEKYSLQELKHKARYESHHRSRDDRDSHRPRRSRSRSPHSSPASSHHKPTFSRPLERNRPFHDKSDPNERRQPRFDRDDKRSQQNPDFNRPRMNTEATSSTDNDSKPPEEKADIKPNFALTGNLAKDTNTFNGVVVKYNEPPEAKKPKKQWRFYPFKGETPLDFIPLHTQSAYLFGRDRRVADIPIDHPSCSKQHAALQFRSIEIEREDGTKARATRPYIIDLESGNGTFVNNKLIEARRYVELLEGDVIKFGFSTREYVLLHEQSQGSTQAETDIE